MDNKKIVKEDKDDEEEERGRDLMPGVVFPPGYRFYPTEEELITFYLHRKLLLDEICGKLCRDDTEQWFFFTPRQEREARGGRPNRTTTSGYWKATGSPGYVYSSSSSSSSSAHNNNNNNSRVIGLKKTMVFYKGKAPTGRKTKWKMNEYRAIIHGAVSDHHHHQTSFATSTTTITPVLRHEFSLCRIYVTSGCLRAFDRRPSRPTTLPSHEPKAVATYQVCESHLATISSSSAAAGTYNQQMNYSKAVMVDHDDQKISSSSTSLDYRPNSSSSGDNQHHYYRESSSSHHALGEAATTTTSNTITRAENYDQWDMMITEDHLNFLRECEKLKWD